MTVRTVSRALRVPPSAPDEAAAFFAASLGHHTDVSDVAADLDEPEPGFVMIDTRGDSAWAQGHVPAAIHLPTDQIPARLDELDPGTPVVVYCWGPGCNGATRAAYALASAGFRVKEMLGGFEYWVREGLPVQTTAGLTSRPADPLTGPMVMPRCDC